jgi:hypothetical protein
MAGNPTFDARDLGWHTVEYDVVAGAKRTMVFAGLWRAYTNLRANATLSPLKVLGMPDQRVYMTMRANATVVSA